MRATINTDFNIGDTVYTYYRDSVRKGKIKRIIAEQIIETKSRQHHILYDVEFIPKTECFINSSNLFSSTDLYNTAEDVMIDIENSIKRLSL